MIIEAVSALESTYMYSMLKSTSAVSSSCKDPASFDISTAITSDSLADSPSSFSASFAFSGSETISLSSPKSTDSASDKELMLIPFFLRTYVTFSIRPSLLPIKTVTCFTAIANPSSLSLTFCCRSHEPIFLRISEVSSAQRA